MSRNLDYWFQCYKPGFTCSCQNLQSHIKINIFWSKFLNLIPLFMGAIENNRTHTCWQYKWIEENATEDMRKYDILRNSIQCLATWSRKILLLRSFRFQLSQNPHNRWWGNRIRILKESVSKPYLLCQSECFPLLCPKFCGCCHVFHFITFLRNSIKFDTRGLFSKTIMYLV